MGVGVMAALFMAAVLIPISVKYSKRRRAAAEKRPPEDE
jgi:hypothetical protein